MKKLFLLAAVASMMMTACNSDKTEVSEDKNGVVTLTSKGVDYDLILVNAGKFNIGATSEMKKLTPNEEQPMPQVTIRAESCKSCGYCVKFCPKGVLAVGQEVNSKGYP